MSVCHVPLSSVISTGAKIMDAQIEQTIIRRPSATPGGHLWSHPSFILLSTPQLFLLHQSIPIYTSLYQSIPVYTSLYPSIPVYNSLYRFYTSQYHSYWSTPVHISLYRFYTSLYQSIPVFTGLDPSLLVYTGLHQSILV